MTLDEIADALQTYHDFLTLMAQTMPDANPEKAEYEFISPDGVILPKLDELANQVRQHRSA